MYLENQNNQDSDVYANLIVKYKRALIRYNDQLIKLYNAREVLEDKIYLRYTSTKKKISGTEKSFKYRNAYKKNEDKYVKLSPEKYNEKRPMWEKACEIKCEIEQLEYIIQKLEECFRRNILTPPGQPSLEEIRQSMQCQNRHMQELVKEHERDNYRGYFEKGNVHASGKVFASRAELLIYEEIKNCGLQVIYEYNFVDEKYHVVHRPDFYGFRGNMPYIIEFFGMMETREYRESALGKIKKYAECGFAFEKNMIAFSTKQSNIINMKTVHTVLKNFSVYGIIPENIVEIDVIAS